MDGAVDVGDVDEAWTGYQRKLDTGFLVAVGRIRGRRNRNRRNRRRRRR